MKKNFLRLLIVAGIIVMMPVSANAGIKRVESASEFNTKEPPQNFQIVLLKNEKFSELELPKGTILNAAIEEIIPPKRLKRDARFKFVVDSYIDADGNVESFPDIQKGIYLKTVDAKSTAKSLAKGATKVVANSVVPGLGLGVNAIEGALTAENGQRIKSAAHEVYEGTFFSFINFGNDVVIYQGDQILMKFSAKKKKTKKK